MMTLAVKVTAAVLLAGVAYAADIEFSDSVVVENRDKGQKVVTTHATNESDEPRSVYVTSGGTRFNAGTLKPGESADVTVVEQEGEKPVIVFEGK